MKILLVFIFMVNCAFGANSTEGRRHLAEPSSSREIMLDEVSTSLSVLFFEGFQDHDAVSARAYQDYMCLVYGDIPMFLYKDFLVREKLTEKNLADEHGNIYPDKLKAYQSNKENIKGK